MQQQELHTLSLREGLRQSTRTEHEQLESALDLMRTDFSLTEYRELLAKYHGFYQSFENFMRKEAAQHSPAVQFYIAGEGRWKLSWLQKDLEALNCRDDAQRYLMPPTCFPALFPSSSYLLGAIYVIEGSMLGGTVLSLHFSRRFGLSPETRLKFFSGYGAATKTHWQALLQLIEACPPCDKREEVILGARRMFSLLHKHLLQIGK